MLPHGALTEAGALNLTYNVLSQRPDYVVEVSQSKELLSKTSKDLKRKEKKSEALFSLR